jgi:acyl carrier protein
MTAVTSQRDTLRQLLLDTFLISEDEFRFDLRRDELDTWDSLGVVSLAVGVEETFGYHMTQDEAMSIGGIDDIIRLLRSKGAQLDA